MVFLIDYENVNSLGMRGTEELLTTDEVILFYSETARTMERRHLENIKRAGCVFTVCKLQKAKKNALDFYISTKLGEIFGATSARTAVIVSHDTGFQAVRDYWSAYAAPPRRVILADSIERGIYTANEQDARSIQMRTRMKPLDIGNFHAAYEESLKLQRMLAAAFGGTEYASRLREIARVLQKGKTPKVIYLESLHQFGRKDGLAIYQRLKTCIPGGQSHTG